jgi:hypothetical protein
MNTCVNINNVKNEITNKEKKWKGTKRRRKRKNVRKKVKKAACDGAILCSSNAQCM